MQAADAALDFAKLAAPEPPEEWEPKFRKGDRVELTVAGSPVTLRGTIFSVRETKATVQVHWQSADLAMIKKRKGNTEPGFQKGDAVTFHPADDYTVAATFSEHHKKYGKCTLKTVWPIDQIEAAPFTPKRKRAANDAPAQPAPPLGVVCISRADFDGEPTLDTFVALLETLVRYISPVQGTPYVILINGVAGAIVERLFVEGSPVTSGRRFASCALASPVTFADLRAALGADPASSICLAHSPSTPVANKLSANDMVVSDHSWANRKAASDAASCAPSPARSTTTTEPDSETPAAVLDLTHQPAKKRAPPEYIEID